VGRRRAAGAAAGGGGALVEPVAPAIFCLTS
jgi:hypothetical protein